MSNPSLCDLSQRLPRALGPSPLAFGFKCTGRQFEASLFPDEPASQGAPPLYTELTTPPPFQPPTTPNPQKTPKKQGSSRPRQVQQTPAQKTCWRGPGDPLLTPLKANRAVATDVLGGERLSPVEGFEC
eukprot:CAMPEP_0206461610 /NCGR_PEP_ID=MMETSP0324_2-20121206/25475_1 /ASSEMBLY_ACC=CAM_ASM_000836 /TAXON_ID=2866 /ORGANISM="Crypthecodinium cohnii, Strain Seligo" /LENGTH=128 /DNA_ID=CAMNT_0053933587 /DNA_START=664 /DNA_END=1047 /DNA_ORIENTATION=-